MGIVHFEDQPINEFIHSINNIHKLVALEKLDGSNLQIGKDETGKIFLSREQKGTQSDRYYSPDDWGNDFWSTGFRSAHYAVLRARKFINQHLQSGDIIDCEVLYGPQPNAIIYSDTHNYIIFLRAYEGNPNIDRLKDVLENINIKVTVPDVMFTDDGLSISKKTENQIWQFGMTPKVDRNAIHALATSEEISQEMLKLKKYLTQESKIKLTTGRTLTNADILTTKLNERPADAAPSEWAEVKNQIKVEKEIINGQISGLKLNIKKVLIDKLLRRISSKFGPKVNDGGWIEGVVFTNPETKKMFKIVDKDTFTKLNKFNWLVRSQVQTGLMEKSYEKIAEKIGHAPLGKKQFRKKYLQQNGETTEEAIKNIAKNISNYEANEAMKIVKKSKAILKKYLDLYNRKKHELEISTEDGKKFKYTDEVNNRTLSYFAELNRSFNRMSNLLQEKKYSNFVSILAKQNLDEPE